MSALQNFLIISAIVTGSLSLIGSSLLICTILRSKKKLSLPYRRLIFATSLYDVFQSWGLTTSVFLSPKGTKQWARGNTTTCDIQGFFTTIGAIGVPIYLCSLCIYYFCIIRLNMKKITFRKIEPFLHAVPIVYSFFCGIFALSKHYFNNAGSVCYVAPSPITCEMLDDQECTRGEGASRFRLLFLTYPSMVIFVIVCIMMAIITLYAKKMENIRNRYSFSRFFTRENMDELTTNNASSSNCFHKIRNAFQSLRSSERRPANEENETERCPDGTFSSDPSNNLSSNNVSNNVSSPKQFVSNRRRSSLATNNPRTSQNNTNNRMEEIKKQALLYVLSYILSYGFVWGQSIYSIATKKPPLAWLRVLSATFFPLQGFMNIFIYCRPHIVSLRAHSPDEYTWFQAFVAVLKSGGDDPVDAQGRRLLRNNSGQKSLEAMRNATKAVSTISKSTSNSSLSKSIPTTLPVDVENQNNVSNTNDIDLVEHVSSEKKPSSTLPKDIENQGSEYEECNSVENNIPDAEKTLDSSHK